jgi:hypothetical protein
LQHARLPGASRARPMIAQMLRKADGPQFLGPE